MAKKTRIPELVVGKIFIDGGDKDKVYTIGSDEDGALRIGDSKSNMVATIDQKTGKIVANSFAGDGSALAGISAEGLAELQTAKLLTLSADKLFFNFDADGVADQSQKITLTAKTQNIDNPVFRWYVNSAEVSSTGATKEITVSELGGNEEVIVTVELDNESLSETVTLHKLQAGRTGRDAVIVSMSNPSVTYQADSEGNIDETDAALMAPGATNIVVRYGAQKLTPVTSTPGDGEFTVAVASSEYVTVPTDPSYIAPDTTNNKMDIGAPANVIAAVGTISFSVTAQVDGETYNFTEIQTFNLSIPGQAGATGEGAKFVKLTSDDYQIGYDSDGLTPDPGFVTLTAASQNHETTTYYRWFVDDVPWNPGTTGTAISPTPTQHLYTTDNIMRLPAESSHGAFGSKKTVRVETQVSGDDDDPIASDSVSIIATKDGSNAIRITADNLSHGFPASPTGQIDASDYADGAVTFQVYHGNENFTPNMTVINNLKGLVQSTNPGTSPDLSSITSYVSNLGDGEYAVLADATTAVINDADANTIDPFGGAAPSSVTDDTGVGIKFSPSNMQESLRRAAINYSFYLRTLDGQLAASTVRTQTFVKGRDGEQGQPGLPGNPGDPGTDAVAVKLVLDDYQVGFDENGGNPQTAAGDGTVTMTLTTQGHDEALTVYRVYKDDVEEPVHNPQGEDWEQYGWRKLTSGTPWTGTHVFDFSGETYSDWTNRKKVVRVETSQIEYVNGVLQDTSNLSAQAQDSTTIIATKEGSNAVEIFADNLSHQFIEDTAGNIDYTGGGIKFSAYIGNTPLVASNESTIEDFKASNETDAFHVSCGADAQDNISKGITTLSDANTFFFLDPSNFGKDDDNRSIASLTFTISVKDSTGTVRPDRTFVQTLTRAKDGSDSKLVRIDASSTVFAFDDDWDWTAQPNEITFNIATQNLASGEEVAASDITFIDKDGNDVSAAVKGYVNPPDGNGDEKTNEQLIEASLQGGSSFSLRFAQFQGLAKDEDGNTIPAAVYQNNQGETIENSSYTLQQLKANGFPLTVKVTKTGLAGAVQTISDETRVLALMGGTNTVQIDAPNSTHLFDADADMVVNPTTLGDAGTDITVYVGAAPLSYDSSGDTELQRGKYRFGDFQYGSATGEGTGDQMVTLSVRSDKTGVDVDSVSHEYTKQTVTLPIEIRRTDGELINRNLFLTYSKVKEGRDGENLKDRNFDFSQGPTGWSLDDTSTKGSDLTSVQLTVDSDEKANFGGSVGVFHFVDTAAATTPPTPNGMMDGSGKSKTIYISEALPVGATAEPGSNEDDGTWLIKFRAKAENHPDLDAGSSLKATNQFGSPIRAWLSIKPFSGDGTPYSPVPAVDNTSPLFYFDVPNTAWASAATVHGKLGFSTNDDAGYDYDDYSVPLLKDHYLTYVLRVTPAEIQAMMGTAASFKIAMRFKGTALGTDKSPLIKVDAFQAEKLPYSSLLAFDGEQYENLQNSLSRISTVEQSRAEEAAEGDGNFDTGVLEDMTSLTNYNFAHKYTNGFPAGLLPSVWTSNGSLEPNYESDFPTLDPTKVWIEERATDAGITDGNRAAKILYSSGKRRSLTFPAMSVPAQNYKIQLKIRYKTSGNEGNADWANDSSTSGPLVRIYFSEVLPEGKKYVGTQDTNYSFGTGEDRVHRRSTNNVVKTIRLDPKADWHTREETVTLYEDSIGSSFNNKTGDLKYFSISLFPGSSASRDHDLYVDYIDCEMEPPANFAEMDRTRSDNLTPWETTTPDDERTAAVTLTKGDPTIAPWVATTPTGERAAARAGALSDVKADSDIAPWVATSPSAERTAARAGALSDVKADSDIAPWVATSPSAERTAARAGALADVKADSDIAPWVATTPGDLKTETKDDTFGDNRFTTVDTKAQQGIDDAAAADTKATGAQTAAAAADTKAINAQTAAGVADSKATGAQTTAGAAQTLAASANTLANTVDGRFSNGRLLEANSLNNTNVRVDSLALTDPQVGDIVEYAGDVKTLPKFYKYGTKGVNFTAAGKSYNSALNESGFAIDLGTGGDIKDHTISSDYSIDNVKYLEVIFEKNSSTITHTDGRKAAALNLEHIYLGRYNNIHNGQGSEQWGLMFHPGFSTYYHNESKGASGTYTPASYNGVYGSLFNSDQAVFAKPVNPSGLPGSYTYHRTLDTNFDVDDFRYWDVLITAEVPTDSSGQPEDSQDEHLHWLVNYDGVFLMGVNHATDDNKFIDAGDIGSHAGEPYTMVKTIDLGSSYNNAGTFTLRQEKYYTGGSSNGVDTGAGQIDSNDLGYDRYDISDITLGRRWTANGVGVWLRSPVVVNSSSHVKVICDFCSLYTTPSGKRGYVSKDSTKVAGAPFIVGEDDWNWYTKEEQWPICWFIMYRKWNGTSWGNATFKSINKAETSGQEITVDLPNSGRYKIGIVIQRTSVIRQIAVRKFELVNCLQEDKDIETETQLGELGSLGSSVSTFTGQHRCTTTEDELQVGMIVSSLGTYDNVNYDDYNPDLSPEELEGVSQNRHKVNPQEAVPVVEITTTEKDKKVLGVVCGKDRRAKQSSFFIRDDVKGSWAPERYEINSLGEGGIWVSNIAGDLENGDYICSSNIPGYGMKQDDDILRNYTVAKITQDCLFDLDSEDYDCKEVEHDGIIYKVAFVGCTYHCG